MIKLSEVKNFQYRINPEEYQKPYGRLFFRKFSVYLTWIFLNLGFTANQVTTIQTIVGVLASVLIAFPRFKVGLTGIILFQIGFLLDNVDGEIARFRKEASLTGKYLDEIGHEIVIPVMYLGFGIHEYFNSGRFEIIILSVIAGLFSIRIDLLAKANIILNTVLSNPSSQYDYYEKFADSDQEQKKKQSGLLPTLFRLFAYPAVLNELSIAWILGIYGIHFTILNIDFSALYILIATFGVLIPIRRFQYIYFIAINKSVEKDFQHFKK